MSNQTTTSPTLALPDYNIFLSRSSQYTIFLTHFQSEYHLSCPCPIRILHLFHMSSKYTTSQSKAPSCHHLSCPYARRIPPVLPLSHQYTFSPVHTQCPIHLQSLQYFIAPVHVQSVHQLPYVPLTNYLPIPCPISTPPSSPNKVSTPLLLSMSRQTVPHLYSLCPVSPNKLPNT